MTRVHEREHRREHSERRPPRADVVPTVDDLDVRALGTVGHEDPGPGRGDLLPESQRPQAQAAVHDVTLPVRLFVRGEGLEGLEDPELGRRHHGLRV